MNKINVINIIKSFFLGMLIGICLQLYLGSGNVLLEWIVYVFISGLIGFVIGGITEVATAYLPISIARPRMYFLINGLIAMVVATIVLVLINEFFGTNGTIQEEIAKIVMIIVIMNLANILDYVMYKKANKKLKLYKERIEE